MSDHEELLDLVRSMLAPIQGRPLRLFVEAFTGCRMVPVPDDAPWMAPLCAALSAAGDEINARGLWKRRPNEVGNGIEPFVRDALRARGLWADTPRTREGRKQPAGYPDMEVRAGKDGETLFYLECKTFNPATKNSTQRTFYLSPPLAKVTESVPHLLVAYQMRRGAEDERRDGRDRWQAKRWALYDLHALKVDVKHEIQASNRSLYADLDALAEGEAA